MSNIAFYIDNSNISDIDVSNVESGNPGIGGTEFLIFLISFLLSRRNNDLNIILYLRKSQVIPRSIKYVVVDSLDSAIKDAEAKDVDFFVVKHDVRYFLSLKSASPAKMKFIIWCHIFICYWELDYYLNNPLVHKIVYVGCEQRDLYRDQPLFEKSEYIYNCVGLRDCRALVDKNPFDRREHIVTYIGSLVQFKGFHLLAEAWPEILKKVPDAQLYVIGNGKIYDSDSKLGEFGIADEAYEKFFSKFLIQNNKLLPSVHFMGKMGEEKKDILLKTKVGVPNPSGITETFCLSAVEMQIYGARIATIKAPGYLDTVKNGILYKKSKDLAKTVISLLRDNSTDYENAMEYFEKSFSHDAVVEKWESLLREKELNADVFKNPSYRLKWVKELIRYVNRFIPLYKVFPPLERILIFIERNILKKITFMDSDLKL